MLNFEQIKKAVELQVSPEDANDIKHWTVENPIYGLRFVDRDGKKILQQILKVSVEFYSQYFDGKNVEVYVTSDVPLEQE